MIVVTGRAQISTGERARFLEVARTMCRSSREEVGCRDYRVYADLEKDDRYLFLEEWEDDDALQRHFREPHTAAFMAALGPLLAEPADALFHTTASTRRLDPARGLLPVD